MEQVLPTVNFKNSETISLDVVTSIKIKQWANNSKMLRLQPIVSKRIVLLYVSISLNILLSLNEYNYLEI